MLEGFRRRLGRLKEKLEDRAVTLVAAGTGNRKDQGPISALDKDLMLDWITGTIDDDALIELARTRDDRIAVIERACSVRSGNSRVWRARAEFCLDAGRLDEAIEFARHSGVLDSADPLARFVLLKALVAAGRREEALQTVGEVLSGARRLSLHALRIEACEIWQGLEPGSMEPLLESARTRVAAGELDAAIARFGKLAETFGPRSQILLPMAAVYQDQERIADAMRVYVQAVEAEPDNVDALCMAGMCARDLRDTATADRLLSRAYELAPDSPFAQYNLGLLRLDQEHIDEAAKLVLGARASTRGEPWTRENLAAKLALPVERDASDLEWACARFKIVHDIEQFSFLRRAGLADAAIEPVIEEYQSTLRDPVMPVAVNSMVALDPRKYPLLARSYKSPLHAADPEPPQGPLVNPGLPWRQIEENYLEAKPSMVYIDDLLLPEALEAVRVFCFESTIWNELKGGYLGAYMPDGFSGRLLLRIASELRKKMPRVIRDHPLQTMWGYKYHSSHPGIGVHADAAAVNVNFWITGDEANLDPASGGLVIYTHDAPRDWSFQRFNADCAEIYRYLESVGAKKVVVPYRANRAVIFDSDLFHETDAFKFRDGYGYRRVNVTMLYGTRAG